MATDGLLSNTTPDESADDATPDQIRRELAELREFRDTVLSTLDAKGSDAETDLVSLADEHSAALTVTAGNIGDFGETIQSLSKNAGEINDVSDETEAAVDDAEAAATEAVEDVHSAQQAVRVLTGDLESLQSAIGEVEDMLDVIHRISEQTNMLALNASIEAARVGAIRDRLAAPFEPLIERPSLTLLVTVPTTLIGIGGLVGTGTAELSLKWMTARPFFATSVLFVLPFVLVALPLSVFHELRRRRITTLTNRFPETLAAVSNVNKIGLSLPESLSIVGQRRTDRLGTELVRLKNDIDWNGDIADGLGRFANRLRVPIIARTTKLFIEANRAGGDLHRSLSIAADDATSQRQLRRERKQELASYLAVVIVGFLVFVGVIVLIDQFYLQGIAQTTQSSETGPGDPGLAQSFVSLDVNLFRLLVFHSALVQAVFSGLVAGKLSDNAVLSGLKYSITLLVVTVVVFLFI